MKECCRGGSKFLRVDGQGQSNLAHGNPEVQFGFVFDGGKLFFGFLAVFDDLADVAGVFAVEGFCDGYFDRRFPGKLNDHGNPGYGLQDGPVSADREDQKNRNQRLAEAMPHYPSIIVGSVCRSRASSRRPKGGGSRLNSRPCFVNTWA